MAPIKTVKSLYHISQSSVISGFQAASNALQIEEYDSDKHKMNVIRKYYDTLPEKIQNDLAVKLLGKTSIIMITIKLKVKREGGMCPKFSENKLL